MPAVPTALRYLALGDSYTIGEAVAADARWPALLAQRLRQAGVAIDEPRIVAVTGWTTDELAHGMEQAALASDHDLVTLQIGVNNQYRGRSAADYREQFTRLLARAIQLAGGRPGRVLVVSIPDWGVTRFAREQGRDPSVVARELDAYNAIAAQASRDAGAHFVDITGVSRQHPDLLAADGLHPAAAQHDLWAGLIEPVVRAALHPTR